MRSAKRKLRLWLVWLSAHVLTARAWQGRIKTRPASRTHVIDHYTHCFLRSKTGPMLSPWRGPLRTLSPPLIFVDAISIWATQLGVMSYQFHGTCWQTLYRWAYCVSITKAGSQTASQSLLWLQGAEDNNYRSQCLPPLCKVRRNHRARHKPQF